MVKKISLIVVCLSLLALSVAASYADGVRSFENCTVGEYADGSSGHVWLSDNCWIFGGNNSGSATVVSNSQDSDGKAIKFEKTSTEEGVFYTSPYPWCNPVSAVPGQEYRVSFWAYGAGSTLDLQVVSWYSPDNAKLICNGNETLASNTSYQDFALTGEWAQYSTTFTAKANTQVEALSFRENNVGIMYLDNISLTAVPEPGSMLAMLSGMAGLVGFAVRKRK
ncbi:MAG: PEP-CTERM sorting domain-containing protein [Armatimonadota bacterium]|nr:carbohydrate binding domain-containing protein [bacterium]